MTTTTDGLCARNRSPHHHKTILQDVEDPSPSKSRKIHSKSGFSRLRIACWLRLRTASNKGILLLMAISLLVMIRLWTFTSGGVQLNTTTSVVLEKKKPRLLQLMDNHTNVVGHAHDLQLPATRRYNEYWINHGSHWFKPRSRVKEGCIPLQDWYEDQHPSCNFFHEIPLRRLYDRSGGFELARLVNNGAYRDVWGIRDFDGDRRVLKTLKYEREFDERNFDRHRRDGMAVEQLSASPHVVDIYGYCANSALYDYYDGGDLFDVFDDDKPSKNELLRIAHDVAQSIADSHRYNKDGIATMAHTDIKPNQFLNMNGTYQLNDFNRCRFLTWNPETQEHCGFTVKKNGGVWRAPEEYRYEPETEKIDVYSLGHVLYFLLTNGKVPFEDMRTSDANAYVAEGKRIHVHDESILGSTHLFDTTLLKALDMCYVEDPKRRPSAQKVANLLKRAVDRIKQDDS